MAKGHMTAAPSICSLFLNKQKSHRHLNTSQKLVHHFSVRLNITQLQLWYQFKCTFYTIQ
jgi:hypothetical protein